MAPPAKFQDPDVDLHKQLDLRQDQAPGGADVPGLNGDINDADGDGLDDNTGLPVSGDMQPMLSCPNCGYEVEGGEPQTVSTEDSTMGDASEVSPGPSAGDLCPNCGEAPLMSPDEMAEAGLGEDPAIDGADPGAEQDPNADPEDPNAEPGADEDPSFDPNGDDLDEGEHEPDEDDDTPFGNQDSDDSDDVDPDDEHDHSDDDDDDEDDKQPAKKPFPPGKK